MANIRLIPSAYTSSNSSYATVYSGEANMYNNTIFGRVGFDALSDSRTGSCRCTKNIPCMFAVS